ncbi:MAG TPA: helix-turn-helix domain-containing protein [Rugosimonospora sp.]|nr:helix-turn-helix domain-containing protein [Rugosimonospora sp.]
MLETVGIKPTEERVYWALLRLPAASSGELAARLDLPPEESRSCLSGLESKGLVSRAPGDPHRFRAAPPDLAFRPLLHRRAQELRSMEAAVGQMADEYRSRAHAGTPVEALTGAAVPQRFAQLWRAATGEACAFVPAPADAELADWPAPRPGVRSRVVYPRAALDTPGDPYRLGECVRGGALARLAAQPPVTMLLVDGATGIVRTGGPTAVVVRRGALLDALTALFEAVWQPAVPLIGYSGEVPASRRRDVASPATEDLRLLSLLLAGLTDDAIAGKMGLSRRTVQRRISGLIELVGVRTRLQLIWQSARRGWI